MEISFFTESFPPHTHPAHFLKAYVTLQSIQILEVGNHEVLHNENLSLSIFFIYTVTVISLPKDRSTESTTLHDPQSI